MIVHWYGGGIMNHFNNLHISLMSLLNGMRQKFTPRQNHINPETWVKTVSASQFKALNLKY